MKIKEEDKQAIQQAVSHKLALYSVEKARRAWAYENRIKYYNGEILPEVSKGHEQITSKLCAAIADKMSSYIGTNVFSVNITSKDITNEIENEFAQLAERYINDIFLSSDKDLWFLEANEVASRLGDGVIATEIRNGLPYHYAVSNPGNVYFGWKTDNYKELEWWAYEYGITPEAAMDRFKEKLEPGAPTNKEISSSSFVRTARAIYDLAKETIARREDNEAKYVRIIDFHSFIDITDEDGEVLIPKFSNVVLANGEAFELNKGKAKNMYHFVANTFPGMATGVCDFEHSADLVMKFDKKLSEEADAVSQAVYHKYVTTDKNIEKIRQLLQPNKSQIIRLQDENQELKVLNLQGNSFNSEPLLKNILNIIRTLSGLQELGQDQVSPNISGRALAMVFQGTIQQTIKKRIRWESLIKDMVVDDLYIVSESNKDLKAAFFDEDNNFKFNINISWPEVLESDKHTKIANVVTMRSGQVPLVSEHTARQMLEIADPVMEERRVNQEMEKRVKFQQELQGSMMQPSEGEGPILNEEDNQGEGIASSQGQAGTAQIGGMSSDGARAQQDNNERR